MAPLKIMIVRHAEKPADGGPHGVRADGAQDKHSLTTRGWQRAGALARFFLPLGDVFAHPALSSPDCIYATRHDPKIDSATRRPRQTVEPLGELAALKIDERFGEREEQALVADVLQRTGVVLIAWAHGRIPAIVAALPNAPPTPENWPEDRFDMVWIFTAAQDAKWSFVAAPQQLLAGDRADADC